MTIRGSEFIWQGKLFRRMPGTKLFVSFHEISVPCPSGQPHLHFGGFDVIAVNEDQIDKMIFSEPGFMASA